MAITSSYSPEIFTLVPMSKLSKVHFDMHPIWSEYYEYPERQEIIEWGVDPTWLAAELDRVHDGSDHCAYPILRPYPLPDRMRIYIKAHITTADNRLLDGYVMNEDATYMGIFADNDKFGFSSNGSLLDMNEQELVRLNAVMLNSTDAIFPVKYETNFLDGNDHLIAGVFSL